MNAQLAILHWTASIPLHTPGKHWAILLMDHTVCFEAAATSLDQWEDTLQAKIRDTNCESMVAAMERGSWARITQCIPVTSPQVHQVTSYLPIGRNRWQCAITKYVRVIINFFWHCLHFNILDLRFCCRLHVCPCHPTQPCIHMLRPNSQYKGIWMWGLWEVVGH